MNYYFIELQLKITKLQSLFLHYANMLQVCCSIVFLGWIGLFLFLCGGGPGIVHAAAEVTRPTLPPLWHYNTTNGADDGNDNDTTLIIDEHTYYKAEYGAFEDGEMSEAQRVARFHKYYVPLNDSLLISSLKSSHKEALEKALPKPILYYGQKLEHITISTGGFIYIGRATHQWIAMTQYVAPLMANFHTATDSDDSDILYYAYNGTDDGAAEVIVEWRNVYAKNKEHLGSFTFQCQLKTDGTIIFIYKHMPVSVETLAGEPVDPRHPIKVGLADAYMIEKHGLLFKRRAVYEYHSINIPVDRIQNYTVIRLIAQPTCHEFGTCAACISAPAAVPEFNFLCSWCPVMEPPCGNGMDRQRQLWDESCAAGDNMMLSVDACPVEITTSGAPSPMTSSSTAAGGGDTSRSTTVMPGTAAAAAQTTTTVTPRTNVTAQPTTGATTQDKRRTPTTTVSVPSSSAAGGAGGAGFQSPVIQSPQAAAALSPPAVAAVVTTLTLLTLLLALLGWIYYAYYNPHSASGQILIKYRPSRLFRQLPQYDVAVRM